LQQQFDKDFAMTTKSHNDLKKKYEALKKKHASDCGDYDELLDKYEALQRVHKDLQTKYRASLSTCTGKKKKAEKSDITVREINNQVKRIKWRTLKFVGNDDQLLSAATSVLDLLNIKDLMFTKDDDEDRIAEVQANRDEWVALYGTDVRSAVNEQRSYVQAQQKKIAITWLEGSEKLGLDAKPLPTVSEMWQVVLRNIEVEGDEEATRQREILFDWWTEHVGACAGNTYYSKKIRRTQQLSIAIAPDGKKCVPPSTEAMAFLMYENCHVKWTEMSKFHAEGNSGNIPKYSKDNAATHRFKARYSDSCTGQSPYGGWGSDGIKRFNELKKAITDMRMNDADRIAMVEQACVDRLHERAVAERKKKLSDNGQSVPEDELALLPKRKKAKKAPDVILTVEDEE
jgi:hypothetical protein